MRILVFRTGQLGDTLTALPAMAAIRNRFPDAELVLLTDRPGQPGTVSAWDVVGSTGLFNAVIFYGPLRGPGKLMRLLALGRELRNLKPDAVFYLAPYPRAARELRRDAFFFRYVAGVRTCFGLSQTHPPFGTHDPSGRLARFRSEADRLLSIVHQDGGSERPRGAASLPLRISEADRKQVEQLWREAGWHPGTEVIAIAPGSKMPAKRWPPDRFQRLGAELLEAHPHIRLALVGGPEDADLCQELSRAWGPRSFTFAARASLPQSAEVLRRCVVYIGNDTGTMHLAAAVGTRCVAIFSARDHPGVWDPAGDGHVIIRKEVPCAGCLLEVCNHNGMECLTRIAVAEVRDAAERVLHETNGSQAAACAE